MEYLFGFVVTHASVIQKREVDKVSQFKKSKVQRRTVKKTTVLRDKYVFRVHLNTWASCANPQHGFHKGEYRPLPQPLTDNSDGPL